MIFTTLASREAASRLIRGLVDDRLVACGTMMDVTSIYRWEGSVAEEGEVLVMLKTHRECWDRLRAAVETRHPYDVPELLAVPVTAGLPAYLQWVTTETDAREG